MEYDKLVGSIYDCAANPELWPQTLSVIRDSLNGGYAMVGLADMSQMQKQLTPTFTFRHSPWDHEKLLQLSSFSLTPPAMAKLATGDVDEAWHQLSHASRQEFENSQFFKIWAGPQGLTDALVVPYFNKSGLLGLLSIAKHKSKGEAFSERECRLAEKLSPHVRRSVAINDLVDKGKLALTLYRQVLDSLSVAVFVVGLGRRVVFTNGSGDALLSEGNFLGLVGQTLKARHSFIAEIALDDAIDRAISGDTAAGISGIGVPLTGKNCDRAAAYVLPITGKDVRGALGPGHCAVFITRRGEQQPMAIEVLRTVFDLTVAEARIALLVAKGNGIEAIMQALDISGNTVRTHLKHIYGKTGKHDQTALGGLVNGFLPPIV